MVADNQLAAELYREKVRRARDMDGWEKLLAGPQLFDFACRWTRAGILRDHPDANEATIEGLMQVRMDLLSKLERPQQLKI
jgi:hypothetical protein